MKKIICILLSLISFACLTACGTNTDSSADKVEIKIINYDGGVGNSWLENAAARFEKKVSEKVYGGKKGVKISITPKMELGLDSISTSATHIYFGGAMPKLRSMMQNGNLADLSDVFTAVGEDGKTIESKIAKNYRSVLKGTDDKYYAIPHYEWFSGLSYDIELFDKNGFYFAAQDETDVLPFVSSKGFGSANFIGSKNAKKSCGPDGDYSTEYDNGLPSSIQELLLLCEYMKLTFNVDTPILYTGGHENYSNILTSAVWASLASAEEIKNCYNFSGKVSIVNGYKDGENFFNSDIPVPNIVMSPELTEATGYYTTQTAARYYANAFMSIAQENGFIDGVSTTYENTTAMQDFISSGVGATRTSAMLIEGTYWYNEAESYDLFNNYYVAIKHEKDYRSIGFMTMPTQWGGTVEPGKGKNATLCDSACSFAVVNARFSKNKDLMDAIKDFIKFLYTDDELSKFTGETGVSRAAFDYELNKDDEDRLNSFKKTVWTLRNDGDVVYAASDNNNATFKNAYQDLAVYRGSTFLTPEMPNGRIYASILNALKDYSAKDIFEKTKLDATTWSRFYKG